MEIQQRINRITGQLKGIALMVKNERSSEEILQQIAAVKKAIDSTALEIALNDCNKLINSKDLEKFKSIIKGVVNL